MIDAGINVNMQVDRSIDRDGSILDYCRLHEITIQPWSPFQYGFFEGAFLDNDKFPELNRMIDAIAASRSVTNTAIAVAWNPCKIMCWFRRISPWSNCSNASREDSGFIPTRQVWTQALTCLPSIAHWLWRMSLGE